MPGKKVKKSGTTRKPSRLPVHSNPTTPNGPIKK